MNYFPSRQALLVIGVALLVSGAVAATPRSLSLKPERTAQFTTDEGTWLSVDVSPDRRTVIFDLLGQLYTIPIGGGEAKPITSGMSFNSQPRFSPDGEQIAFISDRGGAENLWIANADGSNARPLSKDEQFEFSSPFWLQDGQFVLVSKQSQMPMGAFELWAYHVKGGTGFAVVKHKDKPDSPQQQWRHTIGAVASADGKYLYYAQRPGFVNNLYNVSFPLSQIVRRDRMTGDQDEITTAPGSAFRPALSPDGTKLVYGTRYETETGLKLLDLQTGEERWLKYPIQRDDQESLFTRDFLPGYAFTSDGKELVISYGGKIHRLDVASGQERLIPFTANVSQGLGPLLDFPARVEQGPVKWRLIQGVVQSPGGKRLAFSAGTRLYIMDIPGGAPRRLTKSSDREYQPTWSPDGRWIAYVTWSSAGGHIWKIDSEGSSTPVQLTQVPAYYRDVVWSPDGSRIVALRGTRQWRLSNIRQRLGPTEPLDLVWVPAQGGSTSLISPARGASIPHFVTEQEDRVYLYTVEGLVSMHLDGTDRRTHLKVVRKRWLSQPEEDYYESDSERVRISPDGQWLAIRESSQLYLTPAPSFGGEPVTVDLTGVSFPEPAPEQKPAGASLVEGISGAESTAALPIRKLTRIGADSFAWADNGATITWSVGASFFRQSVATLAAGQKAPEEIAVSILFPRSTPKGTVLLRGAKVVTMRNDEVIDNADILVRDNRIVKVGARDSFAVPKDAKTFDLTGNTVVPGLIDLHPHWGDIRRDVLDPENNWDFFANLAYGVTAGRDPAPKLDMFAYQDLVDMGELPGPRAFSTGPTIQPFNNFQSFEQMRDVVRRYKDYYRTKSMKAYMLGNRRQRQWMVEASKELQMMPTTEGGLNTKLNLTYMIDGFSGNEHNLPITPLYKDVIQLMAQSKISYTPTMIVAYGGPWAENYFYENTDVHGDPKVRHFVPHNILDSRTKRRSVWFSADEHVFPRVAAQAKKVIEAGGRVCIGSHGQFQGLGYHWEMWALASGGASNIEVLRSATLRGAEAMGYSQDLGSIEAGKLADLVVLEKDPLQDIRNTNTVRYVMKNGELFSGDTLDQLWPSQKTMPRFWWLNDEPPQPSNPP